MQLINQTIAALLPLIPKFIAAKIAKRYVAGSSLIDAVNTVKQLNRKGMRVTLDVLGEEVKDKQKARLAVLAYLETLSAIQKEQLNCNLSLKLTQIGLKMDYNFCRENLIEILNAVKAQNNFLRIDMEDSTCTEAALKLYAELKNEYPLGTVLQAYLRRSSDDLTKLLPLKPNLRLCKGIYREKRPIAFKDPYIINQNFSCLMNRLLRAGGYLAIATHDEKLVFEATKLIEELNLTPQNYEFQMLLGVDPELREIILASGHPLRIYVPFGRDWYPYCVRRLRENPKIAGYVLNQLLGSTSPVRASSE